MSGNPSPRPSPRGRGWSEIIEEVDRSNREVSFPLPKKRGQVTFGQTVHLDLLQGVDQNAYMLAKKDGIGWKLYSKGVEFLLFPVWLIRPLSFSITNMYGNLITMSVGSWLLMYHIMMMWIHFVGYSIASFLISAIRIVKRNFKSWLGTDRELKEIGYLKKMKSASDYRTWRRLAVGYEQAKQVPCALQPSKVDIARWREKKTKLNRVRTFGSTPKSRHTLGRSLTSMHGGASSPSGERLPVSASFHLSDDDAEPQRRRRALSDAEPQPPPARAKSRSNWKSETLSIDEWRSYPLQGSNFHPDIKALRSLTERFKAQLRNEASAVHYAATYNEKTLRGSLDKVNALVAPLSDLDWSDGDPVPDLREMIEVPLSLLREWRISRVGSADIINGISMIGTHKEIEEQHGLVLQMMFQIRKLIKITRAFYDQINLPEAQRNEILNRTRHCLNDFRKAFGTTVLALSGGGRLAISHMGVMKAMKEAKCLPNIISGSSGGAVFAALIGCLNDAEYEEMSRVEATVTLGVQLFPTLEQQMKNRATTGYNLDYAKIAGCIRDAIGDLTFAEAYQKTGRYICINVTPAFLKSGIREPLLLNALSTPDVIVWSGVVASCCLPILLAPVRLLKKRKCSLNVSIQIDVALGLNLGEDEIFIPSGMVSTPKDFNLKNAGRVPVLSLLDPKITLDSEAEQFCKRDDPVVSGYAIQPWGPSGALWCDGSLSSDIPTRELERLFGAKEIVCSQVNPHHAFFLEYSPHAETHAQFSGSNFESSLFSIKRFFDLGVRQRYSKGTDVLLSPYVDGQDITEFFGMDSYMGSITISPCAMSDMHKVAKAPTESELVFTHRLAQQRTWPQIQRISDSHKLDEGIEAIFDALER